MTGVAHLSTGLYLKGKFPRAPLHALILAAAAPDLVWAALNLAHVPGRPPVEVARIERPFSYIGSLQLIIEPYSHALFSTVVLGLFLAGLAFIAYRRLDVALPVLLAPLGHWVLDYLVHDADLLLWPWGDPVRVGPPFVLDPDAPARGLNATAPLVGFLLQTAVVAGSTLVFLRSFPVPARRARLWLWGGMAVLALSALPVFVRGMGAAMIRSTTGFVLLALFEKALAWLVIAWLARKAAGPGVDRSPLAGEDDHAARRFVRNLLDAGAALAFLVAALYLLQSMRDAQALPAVGSSSMALAIVYLLLGRRLLRKNPSTLWLTIAVALVVGPLLRALWTPGSFAGPLTALELMLGVFSVGMVRTLLRRDVLL